MDKWTAAEHEILDSKRNVIGIIYSKELVQKIVREHNAALAAAKALNSLPDKIEQLWHSGKEENPNKQKVRVRAISDAARVVRSALAAAKASETPKHSSASGETTKEN